MPQSPEEYIAELERKVEVLTQLVEVNTVLNTALLSSTPRIEALLSYIMDAAATITGSEAASVLLWRTNTQELFFAATTSDNEQAKNLIGKSVPLDSVAGAIYTERKPVQVDDALKDSRIYTKVDEDIKFVTRSLLGVPMMSKSKVIGVLEVVNKKQLPWTEEDRTNLSILAEEAAIVIEVAQLVMAMQKANRDLAEVDKLKSDFIAIASHELRTPLGVILGYASFLQDSATDSDMSDHASKVMASALQLRRIIEDMVNLRYLKEKPDEIKLDDMTIGYLLDAVVADSLSLANASNHQIITDVDDRSITIMVDQSRIVMALTNLMNNAIRFTPPGGKITIRTEVHNRKELWIRIIDSGIGMEKESLNRIFEEFFQVEDHMTGHHGGLGIGLSITKALIQNQHGRIWAESEGLGKGSTFIVALPIKV